MVDTIDPLDSASDEGEINLPPPPPGIILPPPEGLIPPISDLEIDLPPPEMPRPNFEFPAEFTSDGDLVDAANSLPEFQTTNPKQSKSSDFRSVWEKRKQSDPSLSGSRSSIYRKIDDIASKSSDTLMDRFSDRFGSDLDKEIIIMRKKDQQDLRSIKPTVELISVPEEQNNEMTFTELIEAMDDVEFIQKVSEATDISVEKLNDIDIDSMKNFFDKSDEDHSGTLNFDEFVRGIQKFRSSDEDFRHFFNVINNLLGELSDDLTKTFIESESFELFKEVGADPDAVSKSKRSEFFTMINELLGNLPDTVMQNFIGSADFDLYKLIAERYGE